MGKASVLWAQCWQVRGQVAVGPAPQAGDVLEIAADWSPPGEGHLHVRDGDLVTVIRREPDGRLLVRGAGRQEGWLGGPGCLARVVLEVPLGPPGERTPAAQQPAFSRPPCPRPLSVTPGLVRSPFSAVRPPGNRAPTPGQRVSWALLGAPRPQTGASAGTSGERVAEDEFVESWRKQASQLQSAGTDASAPRRRERLAENTFSASGLPQCSSEEAACLFGYYLAEFFNANRDHFGIDDVTSKERADAANPKATVLFAAGTEIARVTGKLRNDQYVQGPQTPILCCVLTSDLLGAATDVVELLQEWAAENRFSFELDGAIHSQDLQYTTSADGGASGSGEEDEHADGSAPKRRRGARGGRKVQKK